MTVTCNCGSRFPDLILVLESAPVDGHKPTRITKRIHRRLPPGVGSEYEVWVGSGKPWATVTKVRERQSPYEVFVHFVMDEKFVDDLLHTSQGWKLAA